MGEYQLYLGDCLEFMKTLPDGAINCVVTDPPYGIGESRRKVMSRGNLAQPIDYGDFDWDCEPVPDEAIVEMRRVSREQVIWGGNYYSHLLPSTSSWAVWDKVNGTNDFADCELAWTSHKKAVRRFRYMWNGMLKQLPEERFHPTQKPLALMKWVLENYTNPGDTIFDPYMGSGTTGVAAVMLGRRFIGCERDERYFAIAKKRIEDAAAQPLLIMPEREQYKQESLLNG